MRDLNECKAEIFRRAEERIAKRKKLRTRVLTLCLPLCLIAAILAVIFLLPERLISNSSDGSPKKESADEELYFGSKTDGFSFSLTWGCYGISSYDSESGKLVKASDAARPEDYVTVCRLSDEQKNEIYDLIDRLGVTGYPDLYDPQGKGVTSNPTMTLILSVDINGVHKTITAKDIAMSYRSSDPAGQRFLDVCKAIEDILTATDEWKLLPEYEVNYD